MTAAGHPTMLPRAGAYVQRTAIWIPAGIIAILFSPLLFTTRTFGPDWTLHLWAIRLQQWNIEAMGHPGLFISVKTLGAFYPLFAFVGSGIYSVGGLLAIVLGDRPLMAYKLLHLVALCMAYGGFTWLSVQVGLRGWRSQVPGAVLVTGTYFITNMVGRGDFGEFIAISSIPFLIASVWKLLTSDAVSTRHLLAVVAAVFVLTGSHNITLMWGTVFVALLALIVAGAFGPTWRRPLPWKRVARTAALAAIGAGLNAWYLVPDLAYGLDTSIAKRTLREHVKALHVEVGLLFSPLRPSDHLKGFPPLGFVRLSFPVLFFAWAVVTAIVFWKRGDRIAQRLFVALVALTSAFAVLVIYTGLWRSLPKVLHNVQFTYRLDSYVFLTTAFLVTIALLWQARGTDPTRRRAGFALAAILLWNVGGATWQVWTARSLYFAVDGLATTDATYSAKVIASRYEKSPTWYSIPDFRDLSLPIPFYDSRRTLTVPVDEIHGSSFSGRLPVPDGRAPFITNIVGGPNFVRMTGITAVGRTFNGFIVAKRTAKAPEHGPVRITINQARTKLLRFGAAVSLLSGVALLGLLAWPVIQFAAA